ncbi:hypothetical protein [Rhodohalobacter sp.]|uniref:hypothetical protein n=1 Tax=Rhodohalobacter sp. TaxID=1974210 RepID=UPI002ACE57B9|nr:hypothetical protein [Rhodohalobacter sp.]
MIAAMKAGRFCTLIDDNKTISTEILSTGTYRFRKMERSLNSASDVDKLLDEFEDDDYNQTMLKLAVSGRLEPELYEKWREKRHSIREAVLELKLDDSELRRKVTEEQIRKEFTEGSFPEQLLSSIPDENEDELQMAYELIREVKQ